MDLHSPTRTGSSHGDAVFRQVFELTSDAFFLVERGPDDRWVYGAVNRAAEAFLRAPADQLQGRPLEQILPPHLAEYFLGRCRECLAHEGAYTYDEEVALPSGIAYFSTTLIPLQDEDGEVRCIAGVCRDVTQRRREEATQRESQRLESLGVMAGGIAHDFNNLLTIAMGNLSLLQSALLPDHPAYGCLGRLESALLKGADLTRQILAYSGRGRLAARTLDLTAALRNLTPLMTASISKKIRLVLDLRPEPLPTEADPAQIQQVVMNLVMNAAEAMGSEVGTLSLRTGVETLDEAQLAALLPGQALTPGALITLEVADSGPGIAPEVLPRIFDPFFTTKPQGRGLGLSAVQGILRSHGAGLRLLRNDASGATFKLYFPMSSAGLALQEPDEGPKAAPRRARVLLVDDEPEILEVASLLLESLGYEVTTAMDGVEAVARFSADPASVDLVILDVSMPRMDGKEAFQRIRALGPAPVLFCSGFSREEIPTHYLDLGNVAFLNKPYRLRELGEAIHQLMGHALPRSR